MPSLKRVQAEAERLIPCVLEMLPVSWRFRKIQVKRVLKGGLLAKADMRGDSDGGRCFDVLISMEKLGVEGADWRLQLFTRIVHEVFHVHLEDSHHAALEDDAYNKLLDDFAEKACEGAEAIALYLLTHAVN